MISIVPVTKRCSAQGQRPEKCFIGEKWGRTLKLMYLLVTPAVVITVVPCRRAGLNRYQAGCPMDKVYWNPFPALRRKMSTS